ncbi:transposase, IS605 OrfB family protein [Sulfolobus acidocaldarius Ron12/I]|uniref:Transposase, IS605 OrfB family protein n=2 Tax=Sulfolobus acidocaldarius TaxID=2285 RepID=M1J1B9_9CREN|nr:transposase, IS605 OrfB family protein [Sulfolobus acidocaldarius Ron12/I]
MHREAMSILEDSAKRIGKWVVDILKSLRVNAIFLEDLSKMINRVKRLPIEFRYKLYLM